MSGVDKPRLRKMGTAALEASPKASVESSRLGRTSPRTPAQIQEDQDKRRKAGAPYIPLLPGTEEVGKGSSVGAVPVPLTLENIVAALQPQFTSVSADINQLRRDVVGELQPVKEELAQHRFQALFAALRGESRSWRVKSLIPELIRLSKRWST